MDGAIEVSSEKGEGSTFRFHIKVGLPALAPADPVPPVGYVSRRPSAVGTSQPLDVLIVEGESFSFLLSSSLLFRLCCWLGGVEANLSVCLPLAVCVIDNILNQRGT